MIADLKAKHLKPIPLSGQDATAQGIQYILAGWQTGTVYKYVPDEAAAAAAAAVALIKGTDAEDERLPPERQEEGADLALPVVWITKANYKRLFTDKLPEEERRLRRRLREVLQVGSSQRSVGGAPSGRLHYFYVRTDRVSDTPLLSNSATSPRRSARCRH